MPAPQYRLVVVTDFREQFVKDGYTELPDGVQFLAWGLETCPTTGKMHNQTYAYGKKMTEVKWRSIFKPAHVEIMRGNLVQNEAYCSKEKNFKKLGQEPMGSGHRRDLAAMQELCDKIAPGQTIMDLATDGDNFSVCVQYKRGLEEYVANKRRRLVQNDHSAPEVIFICGKPGTGKTRYVRELERELYDVPSGQWRDNYCLQEAVLYDNLEPSSITDRSHFLKEIDRYPIQVPVKGGFTTWKPKRIYITSVCSSEAFAYHFRDPNEWRRRITTVKDMDTI